MSTAPRGKFHYIVGKPARGEEPIVVYWDGEGWWQPEGALYQDDYFSGWSPIPQD